MRKILMAAFLSFSLSACAGDTAATANNDALDTVATAAVVEVTMLKYQFIPQVLEIKAGQTVRWINQEKRQYHSVWFEKYGEEESDYLFPEDVLNKKFDEPGEYEYRCGPHPKMIGKIIVR